MANPVKRPNGKPNGKHRKRSNFGCLQVVSFRDSRDCVTHIAFSSDSNHLALAHADRSLCLYRWEVVGGLEERLGGKLGGGGGVSLFVDTVGLLLFVCCCHCDC